MPRQRAPAQQRDRQLVTPFTDILLRFCNSVGSPGAALVDQEGETVDYAGVEDPYEIRVTAAELALVLRFVRDSNVPSWPQTTEVIVRARKASFAVASVGDGYAVVMRLPRHAFTLSRRALYEALRELSEEAGIDSVLRPEAERWCRVQVLTEVGNPLRPEAVWRAGNWHKLTIMGRYQEPGFAPRELGFRARLRTGEEFNLVREPLGRWYAEDLLSAGLASKPPS